MYKLDRFGSVIRLSDNASIPRHPDNTDYKNFLAWEALGNTAAAADPAPPPSADEVHENSVLQYAKLRALASMSDAEIDAWVTNNVTNVAQFQDAIKTLAKGENLLLRREFGPRIRN